MIARVCCANGFGSMAAVVHLSIADDEDLFEDADIDSLLSRTEMVNIGAKQEMQERQDETDEDEDDEEEKQNGVTRYTRF